MEAQWTIGDKALKIDPIARGVSRQQPQVLAALAETYGITVRTVRHYRGVAHRWPPDSRRYDLPFSVHDAMRGLDDRFELIHAKNWTVKQARLLQSERAAAAAAGEP